MRDIPKKVCLDCRIEQPLWDFYEHPTTADRLFVYCKECTKRRNTVNQVARRQSRREQGLPVSDQGFANYRNQLAREATRQHSASEVQPSPDDERGFGFGEPDSESSELDFEFGSSSSFVGIV